MKLAYLWCLEKFSEDNKFLDITLSHSQFPQISMKFPRLNPSLTATTNCHSDFSLQVSEDFVSRSIKLLLIRRLVLIKSMHFSQKTS